MLKIELGNIIAQLVIVIVLMLLVSKFALKPMLNTMRARQDHIDEQISSAENNRKEAEKLLAEQREALEVARVEAKEIIERSKVQKDREAAEIIREAEDRASRMVKDASLEINREKEKALAELRDEVGRLSILLASKVMEEEMDESQQAKLVDRYLERVGELQ
ncbi:ATP synthase F0 subcomplex B subunit [Marininema mesophilum]|uniref:ATP synthase subunit b n=1 Tax=Marininema mesophilum TaxID=1048340 RepID=A0A1H2TDN0_9BACL|nr:F0F1 ATP synthase subunit B [Marininema mesophilum]SDW41319.1 ATP synthase F0 subcomplex B subunit [Marininema mesophilum]